jgi:hypothetical protein
MKNNMKKIIITMFAFALLFAGNSVFARVATVGGGNTNVTSNTAKVAIVGSGNINVNPNVDPNQNCVITGIHVSGTGTINIGQSRTIVWSSTGCTSATITNVGSVSTSGSHVVTPFVSTFYTLEVHGMNDTGDQKTVHIVVNGLTATPISHSVTLGTNQNNNNTGTGSSGSGSGSYTNGNTGYSAICGITSIATNVTKTTATFNGFSYQANSNTYFEYGKTQNLGLRTPSKNANASSSFSQNVSGLTPDTTYYFRLVSVCQNGNPTGGLSRIHTRSDVVAPKATAEQASVLSTKSDFVLDLKIENGTELVGKGDNVKYTITYKNIGKEVLKNSVLQVILPEGFVMTDSSQGTFSNDSHIFTVLLNDLAKDAEGKVFLDARVDSVATGNEKIVSTATILYTNKTGVQENATAYVLNTPKPVINGLSAAAIFGGMLPVSLVGWFVLALIVLIVTLLVRKYVFQKNINTAQVSQVQ